MNEQPKDPQERFEDDNVVDLFNPRPKPDGTLPPSADWLSKLGSDTHFRVRDKTGKYMPSFLRAEYVHGGKLYGLVLLIPTKSMNDTKTWDWVEPIEYCKVFELVDIIKDPE